MAEKPKQRQLQNAARQYGVDPDDLARMLQLPVGYKLTTMVQMALVEQKVMESREKTQEIPGGTPAPRPAPNPHDVVRAQDDSMRPADIVAIELGISLEEVFQLANYTGHLTTPDSNPDVDINQVKAALLARDPVQAAVVGETEEAAALVLDDSVLRKQLLGTQKPKFTREDRESLTRMYRILIEWFRLMAEGWRTDNVEDIINSEGAVIGHEFESPIIVGYRVRLTTQQYSELQLNVDEPFPILTQDILDEFVRRLSQLATVPHLCVRCHTQLIQGMPNKVNDLFAGKLALPERVGPTKKMLSKNGYELAMINDVKELKFRYLHLECRVLGPLLDELVRTMLGEGADFKEDGWVNDFVQRANRLVGEALVELRKQFDWPTREGLAGRLADILDHMEVG